MSNERYIFTKEELERLMKDCWGVGISGYNEYRLPPLPSPVIVPSDEEIDKIECTINFTNPIPAPNPKVKEATDKLIKLCVTEGFQGGQKTLRKQLFGF